MCLNVSKTSTFISSVTDETYKINHKFDSTNKSLLCFLYGLSYTIYDSQGGSRERGKLCL